MILWTTLDECVYLCCIVSTDCLNCDSIEDLMLEIDQKYSKPLL